MSRRDPRTGLNERQEAFCWVTALSENGRTRVHLPRGVGRQMTGLYP